MDALKSKTKKKVKENNLVFACTGHLHFRRHIWIPSYIEGNFDLSWPWVSSAPIFQCHGQSLSVWCKKNVMQRTTVSSHLLASQRVRDTKMCCEQLIISGRTLALRSCRENYRFVCQSKRSQKFSTLFLSGDLFSLQLLLEWLFIPGMPMAAQGGKRLRIMWRNFFKSVFHLLPLSTTFHALIWHLLSVFCALEATVGNSNGVVKRSLI